MLTPASGHPSLSSGSLQGCSEPVPQAYVLAHMRGRKSRNLLVVLKMRLVVHQILDKGDVLRDLVWVHYSHRQGIKAGHVCRVSANGKSIIAAVRNSPHNDTRGIWLDDLQRTALGVKEEKEADFHFKRARWYDEFRWTWRSSDPVNRTAGLLGIVSLGLGIIGVLLGAWSVYLTVKPPT